jgi:hypothetical protein
MAALIAPKSISFAVRSANMTAAANWGGLLFLAPVQFIATKAADQAVGSALAAVKNPHRPTDPAAVGTGIVLRRSRRTGAAGCEFVVTQEP